MLASILRGVCVAVFGAFCAVVVPEVWEWVTRNPRVHVHVSDDSRAVEGIYILRRNSEGAIVGLHETDAHGSAVLEVTAGGVCKVELIHKHDGCVRFFDDTILVDKEGRGQLKLTLEEFSRPVCGPEAMDTMKALNQDLASQLNRVRTDLDAARLVAQQLRRSLGKAEQSFRSVGNVDNGKEKRVKRGGSRAVEA
ncbi:MAG: hypothetical protein AAGA57_02985 [Planctomycetota bacterium]